MNEHISKAQIKWVRSLQQKKTRDELGLFVAEGDKCINDLKGAFELMLLVTPENATSTEIAQMSSLRTPQGTIAVFKKNLNDHISIDNSQLILALDGIQDPGNLGTIIRSCVAFGADTVVLSNNTVDLYNDKVLRSSEGMVFHIVIVKRDVYELVDESEDNVLKKILKHSTNIKFIFIRFF